MEGREKELLDYNPAVLKVMRVLQRMLSAGGPAPAMSSNRVAKRRKVESDNESCRQQSKDRRVSERNWAACIR